MRISLNSCSVKLISCPRLWLIVIRLALPASAGVRNYHLAQSACWDGTLGFHCCTSSCFRSRAELRQRFVQLVRQFNQLADRRDRAASTLRSLARNAGNNLHRVSDAFRTARLLFGSERNFLNEFGGLADDGGNSIESVACLIGQRSAAFHFLGAFFHDYDRFVRLGLNRFN